MKIWILILALSMIVPQTFAAERGCDFGMFRAREVARIAAMPRVGGPIRAVFDVKTGATDRGDGTVLVVSTFRWEYTLDGVSTAEAERANVKLVEDGPDCRVIESTDVKLEGS